MHGITRAIKSAALALVAISLVALCARQDPFAERIDFPDHILPGPPNLRWRGDVFGVARTSRVYPRLSARGKAAFLRLGNAGVFTSRRVGFSGTTSPYATAFCIVLSEELHREAFLELLSSSHTVPQLYGLAGIRFVDHAHFRSVVAPFRLRSDTAEIFVGCEGGAWPVSDIVGNGPSDHFDILGGAWARDLAQCPRSGA